MSLFFVGFRGLGQETTQTNPHCSISILGLSLFSLVSAAWARKKTKNNVVLDVFLACLFFVVGFRDLG